MAMVVSRQCARCAVGRLPRMVPSRSVEFWVFGGATVLPKRARQSPFLPSISGPEAGRCQTIAHHAPCTCRCDQ
eukprot:3712199-Alexandrium_andersonii.AAC.1